MACIVLHPTIRTLLPLIAPPPVPNTTQMGGADAAWGAGGGDDDDFRMDDDHDYAPTYNDDMEGEGAAAIAIGGALEGGMMRGNRRGSYAPVVSLEEGGECVRWFGLMLGLCVKRRGLVHIFLLPVYITTHTRSKSTTHIHPLLHSF